MSTHHAGPRSIPGPHPNPIAGGPQAGCVRRASRTLAPLAGVLLLASAAAAQVTLHFEDMFGPCGEQALVQGPASWTSQGVTIQSGLSTDGLLNSGAVLTPSLTDSLGLWAYEGATISFDEPMSFVQLRVGTHTQSQTAPVFSVSAGGVEVASFVLPEHTLQLVNIALVPAADELVIQYVTGSHSLLTIDRLFAVPVSAVLPGPPSDVSGYWPMEPSDPVGAITDEAGSNDGWFSAGGVHVTGAVGSALSLPPGEAAQIPDDDSFDVGTGDLSVACWIRATSSGGVLSVLDKRLIDGSGNYVGFHMYGYQQRLGFQLADGDWTNWTSSGTALDGSWHHVAVTVDRDQVDGLHFYVDGVVLPDVIDPTVRSGSLSNAVPLSLWSPNPSVPERSMDELVFADRVLDAVEIATLAGLIPWQGAPDPWADLGAALAGGLGAPQLSAWGSLEPLSDGELLLVNAAPEAQAALCLSLQSNPLPFKGGLLKTLPILSLTDLTTLEDGSISLPFTWPDEIPAGIPAYYQFMVKDSSAPNGVALSNCMLGITP